MKKSENSNKPINKILWLGSYQTEEIFKNMLARTSGQASAFVSQRALVTGFDEIIKDDYILDTIGLVNYPAYPKYPTTWANEICFNRTSKSVDINIGYNTRKYITYISRAKELKKAVKKWEKDRIGTESNTVIIYEPSVLKLKIAQRLKKKYNAKVFVIIPDIPLFVNIGAPKYIRYLKKLSEKKQRKLFKKADGFFPYSKHMADYYNFADDKWMLMEGALNLNDMFDEACKKENNGITKIMYCGVLDEFRGIPQLLDAFERLRDKPYELWLAGAGDSVPLIEEKMKNDSRIKYFGYIYSREELIKLEYRADILIHTSDLSVPNAPYCFPSKLFEYMMTENPVLSVDMPGIPDEYFDYIFKIKDLTFEGILQSFNELSKLSREQIEERGVKARKFVTEKKSSAVQASHMLSFIQKKHGVV